MSRRSLFLLWVVLAGTLVYLPAIRMPFLMDDYVHMAMLDGSFPAHRGPFDLYDFVSDRDRATFIEHGLLPWWTHPHLTIRFLRPLSSATRWADHAVFGNHPLPHHLHSFVWWIVAMVGAHTLFKKLLDARAAMIATLIFALSPCHALPIAWLANREALIALTFGTFGLAAYVKGRQGSIAHLLLAALLFSVSMSAGEYGLSMGGYVVALEIFSARGSVASRLVRPATFLVPAAAYVALHHTLGYGTVGSGFYRDPIGQPLSFLELAPRRFVTLVAEAWVTYRADEWGVNAPLWQLLLVPAFIAIGVFVPLRYISSDLDAEQRGTVRAFIVGSLLALVPVLAVATAQRLLGAAMLGVAVVIALVLRHAWFPERTQPRRGFAEATQLLAVLFGFAHLLHAPGSTLSGTLGVTDVAHRFLERTASLRNTLPADPSTEVLVMRGTFHSVLYGPLSLEPERRPRRWHVLAMTNHVLVRRVDGRTLELIVPRGRGYFPSGPNDLFRSEDVPLIIGQTVTLPDMEATIFETSAKGPLGIRFVFDRDLDESSVVCLSEHGAEYEKLKPPKPGHGVPLDP